MKVVQGARVEDYKRYCTGLRLSKTLEHHVALFLEADQTGFNWRKVSNDELNGDRRHDAYHEKLRRSVEAIEEYNAGRDDSEQFAITGSLLRQITKVKPGLVKEWMEAHAAELESYNAGYPTRQNTGKPAPRSVIKWSESYGDYTW